MTNLYRDIVVKSARCLALVVAGVALAGCSPAQSVGVDELDEVDPAIEPALDSVVEFERRVHIIAQTCAACHGTDGTVDTAIPSIAGNSEIVLHAQLLAFKNDQMPHATVMPRLAKGFTDEELAAVARYFATLTSE